METILEESSEIEDSDDEEITEEIEPCVTYEMMENSFIKVLTWFERNKYQDLTYNFSENLSSGKESDNESFENIKTPSLTSDSSPDSKDIYEEKIIKDVTKPPVKPIVLNLNQIYDATVISFTTTYSFFVALKRDLTMERRWNRLIRRLKKIIDENKLEILKKIVKGTLCLVKSEEQLHRAIIQNNNKKYAICLGIDNGEVYTINIIDNPIYVMTPKIRNTIEFQAINCKLYNVRLPESPELAKLIYDDVISTFLNPKIKIVKMKESRFIDEDCKSMDKYEIKLFDEDQLFDASEKILDVIFRD